MYLNRPCFRVQYIYLMPIRAVGAGRGDRGPQDLGRSVNPRTTFCGLPYLNQGLIMPILTTCPLPLPLPDFQTFLRPCNSKLALPSIPRLMYLVRSATPSLARISLSVLNTTWLVKLSCYLPKQEIDTKKYFSFEMDFGQHIFIKDQIQIATFNPTRKVI